MNRKLGFEKSTRICRNKDMWFVFIPVSVKRVLEERGFGVGSRVVWHVVDATDSEVTVLIKVVKEKK